MRIFNRRSNNGTNTTEPNAILQSGWAGFTFSSSLSAGSIAVTFPKAFNSAPIVVCTSGGDQASGSLAYGSGASTIQGNTVTKATNITTTGCTLWFYGTTGGWTSGESVYLQWIAVGN